MPSSAYYRRQAGLCARLALASINDPALMDRYSALALEHLNKAEQAELGPMPPPELPSYQRRSGMDHD